MTIPVEYPTDWRDYELLDSGNGEKLERFGTGNSGYTLSRPDPRALWEKSLDESTWHQADAVFKRTDAKSGQWHIQKNPPEQWRISYNSLTFSLKPTEFKHVGVFPEQAVNWNWLSTVIHERPLKVLNLFAYTGGATMAAIVAGARVTHVDAARSTIAWAKENFAASKLSNSSVRWIEDDAYKFVVRETNRGQTYDGIIMDPPRFGRGSKGELWKLEDHLPGLLQAIKKILSPNPAFLLLNAYTADLSSIVLQNMMQQMTQSLGGTVVSGELALKESHANRLLPNGIFARWFK